MGQWGSGCQRGGEARSRLGARDDASTWRGSWNSGAHESISPIIVTFDQACRPTIASLSSSRVSFCPSFVVQDTQPPAIPRRTRPLPPSATDGSHKLDSISYRHADSVRLARAACAFGESRRQLLQQSSVPLAPVEYELATKVSSAVPSRLPSRLIRC